MSNTSLPTPPPTPESLREEALQIAATQPPIKLRLHSREARPESYRDTGDQIIIAFVLAFVFRTFVAEAFIIPTGSMAETLFGRHKDVHCSECGTRFRIGASEEVDAEDGLFRPEARLQYGYCPNCRFRMDVEDELPFKGDRIIVNKFPYEWRDPDRWDVSVFKYPEDSKTNYIKRLVGLPGEKITLLGGDLYRQETDLGPIEILRKPPRIQQELEILVYDDAHPPRKLLAAGFPERWSPTLEGQGLRADPAGWKPDADQRHYEIQLPAEGTQSRRWLRYQHLVASGQDWEGANSEQRIAGEREPLLVGDFYGYNSGYASPALLGENWVGDLTLHADVDVLEPRGELTLELVEGRRKYHCAFDLSSGQCSLSYQDQQYRRTLQDAPEDVSIGLAETPLKRPGKFKLAFANVDDRLLLWVDGALLKFTLEGKPVDGSYALPPQISQRMPTNDDLSPVGIAARGAAVRVGQLKLMRDVFYTPVPDRVPYNLQEVMSNPEAYVEHYGSQQPNVYPLMQDEFLMLGDNSPRSKDSRYWSSGSFHPHAVQRHLLVGKAWMIYWPHGVPIGNNGHGFAPRIGPLTGLLYESTLVRDEHGRLYKRPTDYQANSLLFYPQWSRLMKWIR